MGLLERLRNSERTLSGVFNPDKIPDEKKVFVREVSQMAKTEGWKLLRTRLEDDLKYTKDRNFKTFFDLVEPVVDEQRRRTIKYLINMVDDSVRLHEKINKVE